MNLQFDSIRELEEFLMFTAHIGRAFATAPSVAPMNQAAVSCNEASSEPVANLSAGDPAGNETDVAPVAAGSASATDNKGEDGAAPAEAPRRKRRTKAEIEAERAAAAGEVPNVPAAGPTEMSVQPSVSESLSSSETATGSVPVAPAGNPFAVAPAMQAVLDAPNQGAATLAGMAATQNVSTAPVLDVRARAAAILADPAQVESIAHLRACQGFIQKHGMPKYNESFREGLNANIAVYQPDQRALHLAILESLDA